MGNMGSDWSSVRRGQGAKWSVGNLILKKLLLLTGLERQIGDSEVYKLTFKQNFMLSDNRITLKQKKKTQEKTPGLWRPRFCFVGDDKLME